MSDPVLQLRRAAERFVTLAEGVDSRHLFSFGAHYDPDRVGHGPLLVSNTETLLAGRGFDDHPHADAEILTWVLTGSLVHTDSRGHRGVVVPGLAQRMSAGSGIVHAERNDAFRLDPDRPATPVTFVQMWLRPDEAGVRPSYAQAEVDLAGLAESWCPVASGSHPDAAVTLGSAGCTLWVTVLAPEVRRRLPTGARAHLYVARGAVDLETVGHLDPGDSVAITGEAPLVLTGRGPGVGAGLAADAEVLLWTLPA